MIRIFSMIAFPVFILTGCSQGSKGDAPQQAMAMNLSPASASTAMVTLPRPDHVVILVLENHSYQSIIGSGEAPAINALLSDPHAAVFTSSFGVDHPSQPNYLALYSGDEQGVKDDKIPNGNPFTTVNLGSALIKASLSFCTFSEGLPSVGSNVERAGKYARKHNPASNWVGVDDNQVPETTNKPFTDFPKDHYESLPTVAFVIPNLNNDMHDGSINMADKWFSGNLKNYCDWALTNNSLFILTFDEDDNTPENHITTFFFGQIVKGGNYDQRITHYNVLRTIEDFYKLPPAGYSADSSAILGCWK